jgi:hypothetical protein
MSRYTVVGLVITNVLTLVLLAAIYLKLSSMADSVALMSGSVQELASTLGPRTVIGTDLGTGRGVYGPTVMDQLSDISRAASAICHNTTDYGSFPSVDNCALPVHQHPF